jgi:soluble lytic murein transglycosylase-like protein
MRLEKHGARDCPELQPKIKRVLMRSLLVATLLLACLAGEGRADVRSLTVQVAAEQGVPSGVALALVRRESGFNVRAVGRAGEIGLVQIKLATARAMGFTGTRAQLFEPRTNLTFGMKYARLAIRCGGIHLYQRGTGRCR